MPDERPLKVLFLSAEVVPFAKTGGLADVAGSLPKALKALGHDIRVAMPCYGRIDKAKFGLVERLAEVDVPMDDSREAAKVFEGRLDPDVPVYFVDNARYFAREGIYMYPDDAERFLFFSRCSMEMLRSLEWQPDIIHCNDWHTAFVPNWLETLYKDDPVLGRLASVYTIHNLAYQGIFGYRVLEVAGVATHGFHYHPGLPELADVVDFMARGIIHADIVTTVSERYAKEILTPEYGEKLDPLLRDRQDTVLGILNGVDYDSVNPGTDPHLAVQFGIDTLEKRAEDKAALQREAHLPERADVPLVGMISRLTDQKGFDILGEVLPQMLDLGLQLVLLGTGDQHYHSMFTRFAQQYPDKVSVFLTFNADLAQKIYGGSDMFLMPSRFEPCGLGQMIAMRYGSVPVVRATGGLADTVDDYDAAADTGTGFRFDRYDGWALYTAVVRAWEDWHHRDAWRRMMVRGMQADFSWTVSARKYVDAYRKAIAIHASRAGK
jgi:starch synthase